MDNKVIMMMKMFGEAKVNYVLNSYSDDLVYLINHGVARGEVKKQLDGMGKTWSVGRDERSNTQYMQNIALGWLIEDIVLCELNGMFKNTHITVERNGNDKKREFNKGDRSTNDADLIIKGFSHGKIGLEVVYTAYGYDGTLWMRGKKGDVIEESKIDTYVLAIDLTTHEFIVTDLSELDSRKAKRYNKNGVEYVLSGSMNKYSQSALFVSVYEDAVNKSRDKAIDKMGDAIRSDMRYMSGVRGMMLERKLR